MSETSGKREIPLIETHSPAGAPVGAGEAEQRVVHIPFPESFVYCNCCAFAIGQHELRLGFAEAMQDGKAVPKAGIIMVPEVAAVVALVLLQQVTAYEQNFGEIRHEMWKAWKAGSNPLSPYVGGTVGEPSEPPKP
jgi:hypothetical protein